MDESYQNWMNVHNPHILLNEDGEGKLIQKREGNGKNNTKEARKKRIIPLFTHITSHKPHMKLCVYMFN